MEAASGRLLQTTPPRRCNGAGPCFSWRHALLRRCGMKSLSAILGLEKLCTMPLEFWGWALPPCEGALHSGALCVIGLVPLGSVGKASTETRISSGKVSELVTLGATTPGRWSLPPGMLSASEMHRISLAAHGVQRVSPWSFSPIWNARPAAESARTRLAR